jgi:3-keto-disaccharide hydrolase
MQRVLIKLAHMRLLGLITAIAVAAPAWCQVVGLEPAGLKTKNVKAEAVVYRGRKAVRLTDAAAPDAPDGVRWAIVPGADFQDGIIEADLAGDTVPGADPGARGFTGIAFRVAADGSKYEAFYLRPKNGRAEDQLQRNHTAQYISEPEFPWQRLRQETPGKYESYVDLVPGEWTKIRIEVHGTNARLYVNGAQQPTLIVSDLKHGLSRGAIALWIGPGTVAHFSNLRIARR